MEKIEVKFKKLVKNAVAPHKATSYSAGVDLVATSKEWDNEKCCYVYGTGLAVEIPEGYVGLLFPKSSVRKYGLQLANNVGVIDSDYRGEIMASFRPYSPSSEVHYRVGDQVVQLIIIPIPYVSYIENNELSDTERGTRGHGEVDNI